jgi:hypothetical protein
MCAEKAPRVSRRATRILSIALLAALAVALCFVWRIVTTIKLPPPPPPSPPPPSLEFKLVQKRFHKVRFGASRQDVEQLLGAPTEQNAWEPEFQDFEDLMEARPDRYAHMPGERVWVKWTDPKDENRWAAVHFAGGKVNHFLGKGFSLEPRG